jgi:hypothetical protein
MALTFKLSIDLTGHEHPHSAMAHRHVVARLLDEAKQVFASSPIMRGDCKIVAPNTPPQVVGSWEFVDDEKTGPDPVARTGEPQASS